MAARKLTVLPAAKDRAERAERVVLYARVSSKDQEKEGYSIPAQQRLLRDYALQNGLVVAEEFVDVETAKQSGRTAFTAMLAYLKKRPSAAGRSWWRRRIGCIGTSRTGRRWMTWAPVFIW